MLNLILLIGLVALGAWCAGQAVMFTSMFGHVAGQLAQNPPGAPRHDVLVAAGRMAAMRSALGWFGALVAAFTAGVVIGGAS